MVDRNSVISKTKDTIESTKGKGKTWLRGSLTEQLVLDFQVTHLDGVLGNVTLDGSRSVSDGKVGAVLLVGRRAAVVILLVEVASNGATVGRRDPEIGATGVHNDLELLWWVTNSNGGEVLSVQEVVDWDWVALLSVV